MNYADPFIDSYNAVSYTHLYYYKTGEAPLAYPSYGETISGTEWNGTDELTGLTAGNQIMIIETDSSGKALKAGVAEITTKTE